MIKLCFDGRYIKPEHPDGISRFSLGLIRELAGLCELTVLVSSQAVVEKLPQGVKLIWLPEVTNPKEILTALKLNRLGVELLFSPMQTTSSLGRRFKLILTLHDLIYYRHRTPPKEFGWAIRLGWRLFHLSYLPQRILLNQADLVATVSETTKRQVLKHKLTRKPVEVIYNAADEPEQIVATNQAKSKNLVYMGSFIGYKNVETLVLGMGLIPDHTLILLSRISNARRLELETLAQSVGAHIQFANGVSEDEYHRMLLDAKALVTASLDEGFGIPVIEAMERGLPVIASDLEIFREIGAAALLPFAAKSPEALAKRVEELSDSDTWQRYSDLSLIQAKKFSWRQSAERLLQVAQGLSS